MKAKSKEHDVYTKNKVKKEVNKLGISIFEKERTQEQSKGSGDSLIKDAKIEMMLTDFSEEIKRIANLLDKDTFSENSTSSEYSEPIVKEEITPTRLDFIGKKRHKGRKKLRLRKK